MKNIEQHISAISNDKATHTIDTMSLDEIIAENARRNAALVTPYDPIAGVGSCNSRVSYPFQNEDGTLYYEVMWNYLDLEFYHGDLSGVKRVLTAMSNYMKDEIGEDILVKAYHYILTEEYLKSIEITDITEEGMKLAGLR